jgi:hypothetical protein
MCIDDYVIPYLRPWADNAAWGDIGACTDPGIVRQNDGRMHKSRRAPSGSLRSTSQCLPRVVVPYGNSKSDILSGKFLGNLLDGSVHEISTELLPALFRRVVGVTEYLPWLTGRAIPLSRCVHLFGDPRKLGS